MELKAFGCSHIYGSELPDLTAEKTPQGSKLTWPALLASYLNLKYSNYAWPGRGNLYIADQILNQIQAPAQLFVINWTYIDRFDFKSPDNVTLRYFPSAGPDWTTCRPSSTDQITQSYYKHFHSEYTDKLTTLIQIKACLDALIQAQQPFIMTYMDDLLFDQKWHTSPATKYLQDQIQPYMTVFDDKNFVRYAEAQGITTTGSDHLTAAGHKLCADYIISQLGVNKIKTA